MLQAGLRPWSFSFRQQWRDGGRTNMNVGGTSFAPPQVENRIPRSLSVRSSERLFAAACPRGFHDPTPFALGGLYRDAAARARCLDVQCRCPGVLRAKQGPVREPSTGASSSRSTSTTSSIRRSRRSSTTPAAWPSAGTRGTRTPSATRSTESRSIFYADHPDFEQTNVIGEQLEEGTGGVTESNRTRVIMPFTGIYADNDHVLGHELVHVFQYNIAEGTPGGGLMRLDALPLWLIEGMAEYFSLGREDPLTAMWMRDAVMREQVPDDQAADDRSALLPVSLRPGAVGVRRRTLGRPRDRRGLPHRASTRLGRGARSRARREPGFAVEGLGRGEPARCTCRRSPDARIRTAPEPSSSAWHRTRRLQPCADDQPRRQAVRVLLEPKPVQHRPVRRRRDDGQDHQEARRSGERPALRRDQLHQFGRRLVAGRRASSRSSSTPRATNEIAILDTKSTNVERRIKLPGIGAVSHVSWSPDGRTLAFSGQAGGISDLYLLDLKAGTIRQLTNDKYADIQPTWSPDGKTIAFSTDRGPQTDFNKLKFSPLQLATYDLATGRISVFSPFARGKHINPQFSPDGKDLFFVSDQDGFADIYRLNLASGQVFRVTNGRDGRQRNHDDVAGDVGVAPDRPHAVQHVLQSGQRDSRSRGVADASGTPVPPTLDRGRGRAASAAAGHAQSGDELSRRRRRRACRRATTSRSCPIHSSFSLDAIGQPSVGVVGRRTVRYRRRRAACR